MRGKRDKNGKQATIVIRKEESGEESAHGGAWKVAYADFVTAMMAFFLLMWLLNATTEEQRRGLADYFAPSNLFSHASSGTGEPFGGHTAFDQGTMISDRGAVKLVPGDRPAALEKGRDASHQARVPGHANHQAGSATHTRPNVPAARPMGQPDSPQGPDAPEGAVPDGPPDGPTAGQPVPRLPSIDPVAQEKAAFKAAAQEISQAIRSDPALAVLASQIAIDITPQGLRIQILDRKRRPMFALGSTEPNERARLLLQKIAPVLAGLHHAISITGHTDAAQFPGPNHTNWELSTERANATRRLLVESGFPDRRINSVIGRADHDLLLPSDPLAPANRRIAIVVLRQAHPASPGSPSRSPGQAKSVPPAAP